jgi:undecaprenyl-diphosphatase
MAMSYGAAFISTSALVGFGGIAGEYGMGLMWLVFMNIAFGIIIAFIFFGKRTRRIGLACAAAMILNLIATNIALKNIIQRIRPYEVINSLNILIEAQHDFSFPSGHTACSFAAAWALWKTAPRSYSVPALILAALISFSRLYVGVHFPTDILGGLIVGILCAEVAFRAVYRIVPALKK